MPLALGAERLYHLKNYRLACLILGHEVLLPKEGLDKVYDYSHTCWQEALFDGYRTLAQDGEGQHMAVDSIRAGNKRPTATSEQ